MVTKEQYYDTAVTVLAEFGFKGLNIGVLCRRLGVTSGSFYHHFGSWQGFVDTLLEHWETRQLDELATLDVGSDPAADVVAFSTLAKGLEHGAEAALRAWAANDESVHVTIKRVDASRRETVHRVIDRVVADSSTAAVVTEFGLAMLIGYQQLAAAGEATQLDPLLAQYARLIESHRN
ncbi:TetR family transcriptional regulator [Nocardia camponoti]|uniref:TetR family transcriptional regulator n=1 Tax=Nocardia camponoti TaxID=1616106 RepID=A0A917Q989_9NOCA|nr:TetR family transcriptional regulator [Nocardia camponoti]